MAIKKEISETTSPFLLPLRSTSPKRKSFWKSYVKHISVDLHHKAKQKSIIVL